MIRTVTESRRNVCRSIPSSQCVAPAKCVCEPELDAPVNGLLFNDDGAIGTSFWRNYPETEIDGATVRAPPYGTMQVEGIAVVGPLTVWTHFEYADDPIVGNDDVICNGTDAAGNLASMPGAQCLWSRHFSYAGVGPGIGTALVGALTKAEEKGGSPPLAVILPNLLWLARQLAIDGSDFYPEMFGGGTGVAKIQIAAPEPVGNPPPGYVYVWISPAGFLTIRRSDGSSATL